MRLILSILGYLLVAIWVLPLIVYATAWWWKRVDAFFESRGISLDKHPRHR